MSQPHNVSVDSTGFQSLVVQLDFAEVINIGHLISSFYTLLVRYPAKQKLQRQEKVQFWIRLFVHKKSRNETTRQDVSVYFQMGYGFEFKMLGEFFPMLY